MAAIINNKCQPNRLGEVCSSQYCAPNSNLKLAGPRAKFSINQHQLPKNRVPKCHQIVNVNLSLH
jgi:hypothetical protein